MAKKSTTNQVTNEFIVSGTVAMAYIGSSKYSDKVKSRILLKDCPDIPYELITAFDGSGERLTPKWFKEQTGDINLSTAYELPVRVDCSIPEYEGNTKNIKTFGQLLDAVDLIGSNVSIKVVQKDGAIYPKAMIVTEIGEGSNPFEGM